MNEQYKKQVKLLLEVLPYVAKETCFALHGGTAINLFVKNLPRLSVDIDLTYKPIEERTISLLNINAALERISQNIKSSITGSHVNHVEQSCKLLIRYSNATVKIEVNTVMRGLISPEINLGLCLKAQDEFEAYVQMPVVPLEQLYGGKICAALDRQHPRDMFDIKFFLETEKLNKNYRRGFIYCLLSGYRPINEIIIPRFQDQTLAMDNQFAGMTEEEFSYHDYKGARARLVDTIKSGLTTKDKEFLLGFKRCEPDWSIYNFESFPSIQWKLKNLIELKESKPKKHEELYKILKEKLS